MSLVKEPDDDETVPRARMVAVRCPERIENGSSPGPSCRGIARVVMSTDQRINVRSRGELPQGDCPSWGLSSEGGVAASWDEPRGGVSSAGVTLLRTTSRFPTREGPADEL
jgi:hypothetical protein